MHIAIFIGTRPEAIKMAPVVRALKDEVNHKVTLCTTGQHREMLAQALRDFNLTVDVVLDVMVPNQSLVSLTSSLLIECDSLLSKINPDWVLVQGDTTTVLCASLAAFYRNIKVGHVEAGLRSFQKRSPFPEEVNRKLTSVIADLHFCPTEESRSNLLSEGVSEKSIIVTGNTVIDAVELMANSFENLTDILPIAVKSAISNNKKILLVTCHRRESFGRPLVDIMDGLLRIAKNHPECFLVFPVHLNPQVKDIVYRILGGVSNIHLMEPVGYRELVAILKVCYIVITDSGGLQEESPALHKPVIVLRDVTERPEGIKAGVARLAGTSPAKIVEEVERLLDDEASYLSMTNAPNPYGDGFAATRIKRALYE